MKRGASYPVGLVTHDATGTIIEEVQWAGFSFFICVEVYMASVFTVIQRDHFVFVIT